MSETIYFNGGKYNSPADMPPNIRQMYQKLNRFMMDENQDGVPDMIQSGGLSGIKETFSVIKDIAQISSAEGFQAEQISVIRVTNSGIYINGKEYASEEAMPVSIRNEYNRIIKEAQDGTEDIFDESWRPVDRDEFFEPHDDETFNRPFLRKTSNSANSIQTVDSTGRFIMIVIVAVLILGLIAAIWFLLI
ncbi:hypothetical protein ACFLXI_06200 [Chloroflexota bacterium]